MSKVTRQKRNPNKRMKKEITESEDSAPDNEDSCQKENLLIEAEKPLEEENPVEDTSQDKEVIPKNSLENYHDARKLLRSLRSYVHRIGNKQALLRVHEIDTVFGYVIKNERRPKKGRQSL